MQTTTAPATEQQRPALFRATQCFARPNDFTSLIDMVNPDTGLSCTYGHTLAEIQERHPEAVIMEYAEWGAGGQAKQRAEMQGIHWKECTEERYWDMLCVLPPERQEQGAFLVGEPCDHCRITGRPRFRMFRRNEADQHFELSEPVTCKEFAAIIARAFVF